MNRRSLFRLGLIASVGALTWSAAQAEINIVAILNESRRAGRR